jgi:hypothetical protein
MSLFSRRRQHLRVLEDIPATGPPAVTNHRTPGEMIGAMVDQLRELDNAAVQLQTELATNRNQRADLAAQIVENVRDLGIGPEVVERIQSRRGE